MVSLRKYMLVALMLASGPSFAADAVSGEVGSYWGDRSRGWFWYEDPALDVEKPKEETPAEKPKVAEKPKRVQDMKNAAEIRAEIARLLDIASANPTKANVKAYMEANKYTLDKAGEFTNVWSSVLRETPALDSTIQNPVNALAMRTKQEQDSIKQAKKVAQLSNSHGLFFFFRGDCPYCHAFAPTLQMFAKQFGMEIFPVSLDGGTLPEYPRPTVDSGMAQNLGVTTVPAVFIGDKRTGQVQPVGYGVMALTDLLNRIYTITTTDGK